MATYAVNLNLTYYYWFDINKPSFWILNLTVTYNKVAVLQYGGLAQYLNYLNKTTMLQYTYNVIRR